MEIENVRADYIAAKALEEATAIQVGKDWYLFAGTAYAESNMLRINFFLGGIHHGLLGVVIVPKDFVFLTKPFHEDE